MKDIFKGLWKWILWIVALLAVGGVILALRIFVINKDYHGNGSNLLEWGKSGSSTSSEASSSKSNSKKASNSSNNSINLSGVGQKAINGVKNLGNATVKGYKEDEENYTYNVYNFDEAFLMYEGDGYDGSVQAVLGRLIENSNGDFYARTSVTSKGFGNNVTIDYNGDVNEYQSAIRNLQNDVTPGDYDISFKYGGFGTYVNEIVITKK